MIDLSWAREPVRLKATIQSVVTILTIVGVSFSTTQQDAIQNFATAGVALVTVFGLFDATFLRRKVTPAENPVVGAGTTVTVVTPDPDEANHEVIVK